MDTYPYTDAWKASVDKSGEEWRSYCEALSLVKRFLRIEKTENRLSAVRDYKATLERVRQNSHNQVRMEKLDEDFRKIGAHEAEKLWSVV